MFIWKCRIFSFYQTF